jgi:hypothetical protein
MDVGQFRHVMARAFVVAGYAGAFAVIGLPVWGCSDTPSTEATADASAPDASVAISSRPSGTGGSAGPTASGSASSVRAALHWIDQQLLAQATIVFEGTAMRGRGAHRQLKPGVTYHELFEGFHVGEVHRGHLQSRYLQVERLNERVRDRDPVLVLLRPDPTLGGDFDGGKPSRKLREHEVIAVIKPR